MKRTLMPIAVFFTAAVLTACSGTSAPEATVSPSSSAAVKSSPTEKPAKYHKLPNADAKEKIDGGDVIILDVRTPEEYADTHIKDAVNLPNEMIGLDNQTPDLLPDRDKTILVYCRTGVRSKQASEKLVALGYTNIYDIGGIVEWPYEIVDGGE